MINGNVPLYKHWYIYEKPGHILITPETPMSWLDYLSNVITPGMSGSVMRVEYLGSEMTREVYLIDQTGRTKFV